MQIISDFHDYYDIGMQNGIDPQLPYRRFRREEHLGQSWTRKFNRFSYRYDRISPDGECREGLKTLFFGFAGKIYPALVLVNDSNETVYQFDPAKIDPQCFDQLISSLQYSWRGCFPKNQNKRDVWLGRIQREFDAMFARKDDSMLLNLFETFTTAIFVYQYGEENVIINERLNLYGFQKVLPPMQAFQALAMYVGSYLTKPVIEEPTLPDKIKAEIHGFDQFSFRKDKR